MLLRLPFGPSASAQYNLCLTTPAPHLRAVRHLLLAVQEDLLPDALRHEEPLGLLRHDALGKQSRVQAGRDQGW